MTKKRIYSSFLAISVCGMMLCSACHQPKAHFSEISLEKMNGFPTGNAGFLKGISALYAGTIDEQLVIAGGCNFPDIPVADGGKKVFYNEVYATPLTDDTLFHWRRVGSLPNASAYGVTISTQNGLICVGGTTATHSLSDVILLSLQQDALKVDTLPSLPVTIDNMSGALLNHSIYIVGGNVNGQPSSNVYLLDLSDLSKGWQQEASVPGDPRVQPICVAQSGKLYVWGGFAPAVEGEEASLSTDGYRYDPKTKEWEKVATPVDEEGNPVSLGGGVGIAYGDDAILCAGGVNKDIFLKALQGIYKGKEYLSHPVEWYRFNDRLLMYNLTEDRWICLGKYPQGARAGAAMVSNGRYYYIINGELKPGIRTNEINRLKSE